MKNLIIRLANSLKRKEFTKELTTKSFETTIDRYTIFPDVSMVETFDKETDQYKYVFVTNVRILKDSKYYLSHITQGYMFYSKDSMNQYKTKGIQDFMKRCYIFFHIGIINPDYIMTFSGEPASIIDPNQISEIDRLTNIVKANI